MDLFHVGENRSRDGGGGGGGRGTKLLQNKAKHSSLSTGERTSLTKPQEKLSVEEEIPGIDSAITNI